MMDSREEETFYAGLQGKRGKERKKEVGGGDKGISVLTRRERQQRRLSQSVGTDWKEAAELDSKQSRERDRLLERRYTEE